MSTRFSPSASADRTRARAPGRHVSERLSLRVALFAFLALSAFTAAGCTASEPSTDPSAIGTQSSVCGDRVDVVRAQRVVDQSLQGLRETNTFTAAQRAGTCVLTNEQGGVLSVAVVHDPKGVELSKELQALSTTDNYTGDNTSGVTGEGQTTTALLALDGTYYVRVLGLGGTSEVQRTAALDLARDVVSRTAPIP